MLCRPQLDAESPRQTVELTVRAVAARLAGERSDVAVDLIGTAFQKKVWDALMRIPVGETRSYAELAAQLGQPDAARAHAPLVDSVPRSTILHTG